MSDRGYATLIVLVFTGLLAASVSMLLTTVRPNYDLSRLGADKATADALLEGGLNAAAFLLFEAQEEADAVNGRRLSLETGSIRLAVRGDNGRIDLNGAERDLLAGLFESVGGQSLSSEDFAARIIDWRDEDNAAELGGAEHLDYENAGLEDMPPNHRFRSVAELRYLLGLSAPDFARLHPHITVFNPDGKIDLSAASPAVLAAIPGLSPRDIERLAGTGGRTRQEGMGATAVLDPVLNNYAHLIAMEPAKVYRIRIEARTRSGYRETAEAAIMAPADEGEPFRVLAWSPARNSRIGD